ncbi:MAG: DUF2169 domain-containing protein [Polyangiaceae bacterium]|nr:DUF2169 domain-containing protein [Polyangiaceae bacterium]
MSLPKVDNDTDFVAEPHLLADRDGERLCAIVKATFELVPGPPRGADGSFVIAPKARRRPIRAADIPWGDPERSSIRYPSDLFVRKPATDVVVVAAAHAPGGAPVPSFDAGVRLAKVQKVIRVTGTRLWVHEGDAMTEPRPIRHLLVRYDDAFGGTDISDPDRFVEDARNPVGRGIAANLGSLDQTPAPQIEDPESPISTARSKPKPAGLGVIGRHWEPRRKRWGTYDKKWQEDRAPLPPLDFDDRANQCATPDLIASPPLVGGEEGALTNLTPNGGTVGFVLPRVKLDIRFRVKGRNDEIFTPAIDTVILDTFAVPRAPSEEGAPPGEILSPLAVELVWRASVRGPRSMKDAEIRVQEKR